jgi:phospholipase/carboxylesterase
MAAPVSAQPGDDAAAARLSARFEAEPSTPANRTGVIPFEGGALLYVPKSYRPDRPTPLLIMLHGANGNPERALAIVRRQAAKLGFLVLAPKSRGATWDVIARRAYGPDVAALDALLVRVAGAYRVDPARVALGGFSDGASYALSLGLSNGALFSDVIAFSAGFMAPKRIEGRPRIFLSHGTADLILPVEPCGRHIAAQLREAGFELRYTEFGGGHEVPEGIADEALARFAAG